MRDHGHEFAFHPIYFGLSSDIAQGDDGAAPVGRRQLDGRKTEGHGLVAPGNLERGVHRALAVYQRANDGLIFGADGFAHDPDHALAKHIRFVTFDDRARGWVDDDGVPGVIKDNDAIADAFENGLRRGGLGMFALEGLGQIAGAFRDAAVKFFGALVDLAQGVLQAGGRQPGAQRQHEQADHQKVIIVA